MSLRNERQRQEEARLLPRAESQGEYDLDPNCDPESGSEGIAAQNQQIGGDRANGEKPYNENSFNSSGEAAIGGILRQLEEIHQDYLAYIEAHSARLRARLAEDDERRREAVSKIERLKQQIVERFGTNLEEEPDQSGQEETPGESSTDFETE